MQVGKSKLQIVNVVFVNVCKWIGW